MPRALKLLLIENVDNLGIVGDVVSVRKGYARNFLLPRSLATTPSDEKIKELAGKRADAERQLAELRKKREGIISKLEGLEIKLERSCNDQGILYGAVTQQDVATLLRTQGYEVVARDVRIGQSIKRVDSYEIHVKFASDLEATIKLVIAADRPLDLKKDSEPAPDADVKEGAQAEAAAKGDGRPERRDRRDREDRPDRRKRGDFTLPPETPKGWGPAPGAAAGAPAKPDSGKDAADAAKPAKGEKKDSKDAKAPKPKSKA
ncbi:MAG: 50S ribosomal protein L9 [Phycisphaerae bacterium]|nr:50S ribosomal protein L9 [Phycisphaerae bacterium]